MLSAIPHFHSAVSASGHSRQVGLNTPGLIVQSTASKRILQLVVSLGRNRGVSSSSAEDNSEVPFVFATNAISEVPLHGSTLPSCIPEGAAPPGA